MTELKEILERDGVEKVSINTHIMNSILVAIANKDFDKLSKTTSYGFIRILEREYGIDMEDWKSEYKQFLEETDNGDHHVLPIHEAEEPEKKESKTLMTFITLGLLAVLGYLFMNYSKNISTNYSYESATGNETINKAQKELVVEKPKKEVVVTVPDTKVETSEAPVIDEPVLAGEVANITVENIDEPTETSFSTHEMVVDVNETLPVVVEAISTPVSEATLDASPMDEAQADEVTIKDSSVTFSTNEKLWLGMINLETGKKESRFVKNNYEQNLSGELLFITGHGHFNINSASLTKSYREAKGLRYYYHDGVLNEISKQDYRALNRGKDW